MENNPVASAIYQGRALRQMQAAARHASKGDVFAAMRSVILADRNMRKAQRPPKRRKPVNAGSIISTSVKSAVRRVALRSLEDSGNPQNKE